MAGPGTGNRRKQDAGGGGMAGPREGRKSQLSSEDVRDSRLWVIKRHLEHCPPRRKPPPFARGAFSFTRRSWFGLALRYKGFPFFLPRWLGAWPSSISLFLHVTRGESGWDGERGGFSWGSRMRRVVSCLGFTEDGLSLCWWGIGGRRRWWWFRDTAF